MNLIIKNIIVFFGKIFFIFKRKNIPKNPKKILIMRSGGIGDVLMSTPLVKAIRQHYKNAEITYFVGNWSKDVLKDNPNIDKLFNYDDLIIINLKIFKIFKLIKRVRREKFDLMFNLEKSWHWAVLSFLFGIPSRIGFNRKGEGFANNLTVLFNGSKYELEYYLDLAKLLNMNIPTHDMQVYLTKQEKEKAANLIKKNNLKNKIILGIAPGGADNPAQQAFIKRWPLKNYVKLINKVVNENKKIHVVLFGGNNDIEACKQLKEKVKNKDKVISTAGELTVKESAALMRHCKIFLTHDAGPMHIAAAVKVKLLALFSPTQSERFAPKNATTIEVKNEKCPCYDIYGRFKAHAKECMYKISFDDTYLKMKNLLSK